MTNVARPAPRRTTLIGALVVTAVLTVLYAPVLRDLVETWWHVSYHTYGFFIAPFSVWLAWESRDRAFAAPLAAWRPGAIVVAAALATLVLGIELDSLVLRSLSLPLMIAGVGLFALGPAGFRPFAFPVGFLALMTPLPTAALTAISLPLQHLAAAFATWALNLLGITAVRDGLYITLPAVWLHVSEDCNGLRFLLAMIVVGIAFGALTQGRMSTRVVVLLLAVATALVANLLRVTGTGVVAHAWGREAATGMAHLVYGKAVYLVTMIPFVVAVVLLKRTSTSVAAPEPA
jgi:exosortase